MANLLDVYIAEYNGLSSEINTRLQARESLMSIGTTAVLGMLTAGILGTTNPLSSASGQFIWRDALLIVPLLAFIFQAMLLRHFVRIATISFYELVDLSERMNLVLKQNTTPESGPLGWVPFLNRGLNVGYPGIERILGLVEFAIFPFLGLFASTFFLLTQNKVFDPKTIVAIIGVLIILVDIRYSVIIRGLFVQTQVTFVFPELLVRAYYKLLSNNQSRQVIKYMFIREMRNQLQETVSIERIEISSITFRRLSKERNTLIGSVIGQRINKINRKTKYQAQIQLILAVGRWYISKIEEVG